MNEHARILVVEDEAIIAMHIENTLESLGYAVSVAASAEEALRIAAQVRPDLALLDIILSGNKDGIEAAAELSHQFDLPFVYLTGHSDDRTVERAKATEPLGYVLKPFHEKQLGTTIEIALRRHAREKSLKSGIDHSAILLDIVPDAVLMTDLQAKVSFLNAAGELLTGSAREVACQRNVGDLLQFMPPPQVAALVGALNHALREGEIAQFPDQESLFVGTDGFAYRGERIVPLQAAAGSVSGAALVFRRAESREQPQSSALQPGRLASPSESGGGEVADAPDGQYNSAPDDPLTGLPARPKAQIALADARRRGLQVFVAAFVVDRFPVLAQRFGLRVAEQALQVYSVFLAQNLNPGDELYRWTGPSFVALLQRDAPIAQVRSEVARLGSVRLERVFEMSARSALLFISSGWTVFEVQPATGLDELVRGIDDFVSVQQRRVA